MFAPLLQAYEYPPAPPEGLAVAVPVPVKHPDGVEEVDTEMAVGSVTLKDRVPVQLFASVIVTVYVPADKPVGPER